MQEFYDFINAEWKKTFNTVYSVDHESNLHDYEEIDITKIHDNNYHINKSLLNCIRFTIISMISMIVLICAVSLK